METRINCLESKSYEKSELRLFPLFGVLTACFNSFQFYLHTVSYSAIELYTAKQQPFFHRPPNRDPLWLFRGCIVCAIPLLPALMSLVCVCALSALHGSWETPWRNRLKRTKCHNINTTIHNPDSCNRERGRVHPEQVPRLSQGEHTEATTHSRSHTSTN